MSIDRMIKPMALLAEVQRETGLVYGINDMTVLSAFWNAWHHKLTDISFKKAAVKYKEGKLDIAEEPK